MLVNEHETWDVHDSSKLQTFMTCPRKYFYRYVLGWTKEAKNIHLVHGSGWHKAMEILLEKGHGKEAVAEAWEEYNKIYREAFPDDSLDMDNAPKNPGNVLKALAQYAQRFSDSTYEVLYIEISGAVPIDHQGRKLHLKMDSILRDLQYGKVFSREHKTTRADTQVFRNQWSLKFQIGTYTHALYSLFPKDEVEGIEINGAIFRKKGNDFVRIPTRWTLDRMNDWLWEANHWMDMIEWNLQELADSKESDQVMMAFPKNRESCFKWMRACPYYDFCTAWPNPLQKDPNGKPPFGFDKQFWDPRKEFQDTKYEVVGDKLGENVELKERGKKSEDNREDE